MIQANIFKQFRLHKYNNDYYRIPEEEAYHFFSIVKELEKIEYNLEAFTDEYYTGIKTHFHNMYDKYIIKI